MKKIIYFSGGIMYVFFCYAQEQSPLATPPIYVTVNTTQANQTTSSSNATAISYAVCKQWVFQSYAAAHEVSRTIWQMIKDHVLENKLRYILYTIIGGYAGLLVYIHTIEHFITDRQCWHNWTDTISLEALYALDHQLLGEKLNYAIQRRYFDQYDPINRVSPIILFFMDIAQEKKTIDRYCFIVDWLESFSITKLPGIHLPSKEALMQIKRHVLFLEQIAITWCLYDKVTEQFQDIHTKRTDVKKVHHGPYVT